MSLAKIEHTFMSQLLHPQVDSEFLSCLSATAALTPMKQLSIYRRNINDAHESVLKEIYPACMNVLGEDYFNQLCHSYRLQYPSVNPDLNCYGNSFSAFIQERLVTQEELSDFVYLPDLATLEWHWHASYYAKDDDAFDFERLARVDVSQHPYLTFEISHSFSLHISTYPTIQIWQSNRLIPESEQTFFLPDREVYFCIHRVEYEPLLEELNETQFTVLLAINEGLPLIALATRFGAEFQMHLLDFINNGWVTGFDCKG